MFQRQFAIIAAVLFVSFPFAVAGERGEGKYSGVAIFDRWGGCTLYSGIYVMYVAEEAKAQLADQAGKCVQIDATKVEQPHNPGDGLIKKLTVLGTAPAMPEWESPSGMTVKVTPSFKDGQKPAFLIRVDNTSEKPVTLRMNSLAPSLLASKQKQGLWSPSNGPSTAVVTRQSFWVGDKPRLKGANATWHWTVTKPETLKEKVSLHPKEGFEIEIAFKLPAGEYDFLAGYGGGVHAGQCIASNLIAFDMKADGTASLVKVDGR